MLQLINAKMYEQKIFTYSMTLESASTLKLLKGSNKDKNKSWCISTDLRHNYNDIY